MIIGSFVVFDKYNYGMTESVFHLLRLYSLSRLGFPLPYKVMLGNSLRLYSLSRLGFPLPYKVMLGNSHSK